MIYRGDCVGGWLGLCIRSFDETILMHLTGLPKIFVGRSLVPCASICERNLMADTARVVDKNKVCKREDDGCRKIVADSWF